MVKVVKLSTQATEIDEDVERNLQKIVDYHKAHGCVGLGVVMLFCDGTSVTFGSKATNRREMIGAMVDLMLDYQKES